MFPSSSARDAAAKEGLGQKWRRYQPLVKEIGHSDDVACRLDGLVPPLHLDEAQ